MSEEQPTVWVRTEPRRDGSGYVVTIDAGEDFSKTLDPPTAMRHAYAVLQVAHRAAHDAAVMKQLTHLGVERQYAAALVVDLRKDRPPVKADDLAPFSLEPGVSAFTGQPFLHVSINGKRVGQWEFVDAQQHALHVIGSVAVADLDSALYVALVGQMGLDKNRAHAVVTDLGNFHAKGLATDG